MFSRNLIINQDNDHHMVLKNITNECNVPSSSHSIVPVAPTSGSHSTGKSPLKCLFEQLGGMGEFNYLVLTFCENIEQDETFHEVLNGIETERLSELISTLLDSGLSHRSLDNDKNIRSRIIQKNKPLVEVGLNADQWKRLQEHFEDALKDSWVRGEVFQQCAERFQIIQDILKEATRNPNRSMGFINLKVDEIFGELRNLLDAKNKDSSAFHANRADRKVISARSA